jgi:hypothetical protein
MKPDRIPRDLWDEYDSLQKRADQVTNVAHSSWAIEDQLNTFLDSLSKGCLPADVNIRQKQLNNLKVNRQKKHLHRFRLLESFAAVQAEASGEKTAFDKVLQAEQLVRVRSLTDSLEWSVLWGLARDDGYQRLAVEQRISVAALKTRVSRCRCRLRERLAA